MGVLTRAMMRLRDEIVISRHSRLAFRGELVRQAAERRSQVSALCTAFARDRAGAHRAWFGPTLSERRTAERKQQQELAEAARAKAQEEQRRLAEEARAKAHVEEQRRLAEEARAKAHAERQPPAPAVEESQEHKTAAPVARPPAVPLPPAQRQPFKGSKKH
jgi:hypothetical protein